MPPDRAYSMPAVLPDLPIPNPCLSPADYSLHDNGSTLLPHTMGGSVGAFPDRLGTSAILSRSACCPQNPTMHPNTDDCASSPAEASSLGVIAAPGELVHSGSGDSATSRRSSRVPTLQPPAETISEGNSTIVPLQPAAAICVLSILPVEVIRYICDHYLAMRLHFPLRLVCRAMNRLVTSNCQLWNFRLQIIFDYHEAPHPALSHCNIFQVYAQIESGELTHASLVNVYCFRGCCYEAWVVANQRERERRIEDSRQFEQYALAANMARAIFFPPSSSTVYATAMVLLSFILLVVFVTLNYLQVTENYITYVPLWVFLALNYPTLYLFYCNSPIEPFVLSIIFCIGTNLTAVLIYFYRTMNTTNVMSWLSCCTPMLLCLACSATYSFLVCHRWLAARNVTKSTFTIACATSMLPLLLLITIVLLALHADATHGARQIFGDSNLAGMPLLLMAAVVGADIGWIIQTFEIYRNINEEMRLVVVFVGCLLSDFVVAVLAVMLLANASRAVVFCGLITAFATGFATLTFNTAIQKDQGGLTMLDAMVFPQEQNETPQMAAFP